MEAIRRSQAPTGTTVRRARRASTITDTLDRNAGGGPAMRVMVIEPASGLSRSRRLAAQAPDAILAFGFSKATCSPKQRTRWRWLFANCRSSCTEPELAQIELGRASTHLFGGSSVEPRVVTSQM